MSLNLPRLSQNSSSSKLLKAKKQTSDKTSELSPAKIALGTPPARKASAKIIEKKTFCVKKINKHF